MAFVGPQPQWSWKDAVVADTNPAASSLFVKGPLEGLDGNWKCMQCANVNFGTRMTCNRCQVPKPSDHELAERAQVAALGRANPNVAVQPAHRGPIEGQDGNWKCLSCSNVNFANRTACNRCAVPKPSEEQIAAAAAIQAVMPPAPAVPQYGKASMNPNKGQPTEGVDGSWKCFMCQNINFSTRAKCHRCGTEKSVAQQQAQMAQLTDPNQFSQMAQQMAGADSGVSSGQLGMGPDPQVTLLQEQMAQMAQRQMQLALTVTSLQTQVQQLQAQLAQYSMQQMQVAGNMHGGGLMPLAAGAVADGAALHDVTALQAGSPALEAAPVPESMLGKRSAEGNVVNPAAPLRT